MTTESMKPYPAYKDSGIEWIGEIPEGWNVVKLKRATQFLYGQSLSDDNRIEGSIPVYGSNGITGSHNKSITKEPCIIIGRKGSFGKVNYSKSKCFPIDTTFYIDEIATKNNIRWLYYVLLILKLDSYSKDSAVPGLSREETYEKKVLLPSSAEQQSIAIFLDNQTSKIDTLIENKQKQIELLKEERTAIINQAVTKGLNPDVPMRDSGIEWLGEIPEHWGITKLKFILNKIGSGLTPRGGAEVYQDYGVPLLRSQNVHFDGLRLDDVAYISNETHKSMNRSAVKPDDVLINITGASIGRCAIIPTDFSDGNVNQHVCILRTSEKISSKYLHLLLSSQIGQLQVFNSQNGAAREGLNFEQLGDFFVTLPLLDEQNELTKSISAYIDESMVLIYKIQQQITLLKEYRTALISDAVTGKIDLRNQHEIPTPQ